jgi:hypothetical protein
MSGVLGDLEVSEPIEKVVGKLVRIAEDREKYRKANKVVVEPERIERLSEKTFPRAYMVKRHAELLAMGREDLAAKYFAMYARTPMSAEEVEANRVASMDYKERLRDAKCQAAAILDGIKHRREVVEVNAQGIKRRLGPKVEGIRRLLED